MAIRCRQCGRSFDPAYLEDGQVMRCPCGGHLDLSCLESPDDFLRFAEGVEDRKRAREIQLDAQGICRMILDEECPAVDIEIAKDTLKRKVEKMFPDKIETYRMIYEARFNRLWDQFRKAG